MSVFAALALYPLLAITNLVAISALRLGRKLGLGFFSVSVMLSAWVVCLILLEHPETTAFSERALPLGIIMSGPFVHAGADLLPMRRRYLFLAYGFGVICAAIGLLYPRAYFLPGFEGPGPLFWPIAALSFIGVLWTGGWITMKALEAQRLERRRRLTLAIGCISTAIGTGGATGGYILGISSLTWAAPPLLLSITMISYSILGNEIGRKQLIIQGLVYTLMTAILGAFGVTLYICLLPYLAPDSSILWILFITFLAALPLDQLRALTVESIGRLLFSSPIGIRDLVEKVHRIETRAEHVEGLAEIGIMASAVAHELRNPLGVIKAQAVLLERRGADPKSVARLRQQVDRASTFINDLLRYSKPRPISPQLLNVHSALKEVIQNVRDSHQECPIITLESSQNLEIEVDEVAFHDVHTTIILNALAAGASSIEITMHSEFQQIEVQILDDGPGVPSEIVETMFEPFVTGRGRDKKFPGTGLGLAIAKRWLNRHGGSIVYQKSADKGACFMIRWPKSVSEYV